MRARQGGAFQERLQLWVKILYPKIRPWVEGMIRFNDPMWAYYSEYLYDEVMRMYLDVTVPNDPNYSLPQ